MDKNLREYLEGKKLFGDDFSIQQIENWFNEEIKSYASMYKTGESLHEYIHHALNQEFGFRFLPNIKFEHVIWGV
jgi:Zn-dependent M32 family carboxypeptidase